MKHKYLYDFQQFQKVRSFRDSIFSGKITISEADKNQGNLAENINSKY